MDKNEILEMSRAENQGKEDERTLRAMAESSKLAMHIGCLICMVLVFVSVLVDELGKIGIVAWLIYFSMKGVGDITLYTKVKENKHLISGILELIAAVLMIAGLVVMAVKVK